MVIDFLDNEATSPPVKHLQSVGPLLIRAATDQSVFKQGKKCTIPSKITISLQSQYRDKRHTNEELAARSCLESQVNQQPAIVAAVQSPKVTPKTSITVAFIDKLCTEISALVKAMKNILIIVQN